MALKHQFGSSGMSQSNRDNSQKATKSCASGKVEPITPYRAGAVGICIPLTNTAGTSRNRWLSEIRQQREPVPTKDSTASKQNCPARSWTRRGTRSRPSRAVILPSAGRGIQQCGLAEHRETQRFEIATHSSLGRRQHPHDNERRWHNGSRPRQNDGIEVDETTTNDNHDDKKQSQRQKTITTTKKTITTTKNNLEGSAPRYFLLPLIDHDTEAIGRPGEPPPWDLEPEHFVHARTL